MGPQTNSMPLSYTSTRHQSMQSMDSSTPSRCTSSISTMSILPLDSRSSEFSSKLVMRKTSSSHPSISKNYRIPREPTFRCQLGYFPLRGQYGQVWHYDGSFTTPPCTEGVKWWVLEEPVKISWAQLDAFEAHGWGNANYRNGEGNNRIVQPLNERTLYYANYERDMPAYDKDEYDDMPWFYASNGATALFSAAFTILSTSLFI